MALKTFNVEEKTYKKFSDFCRERGISMSRQVELFMQAVLEEKPKAKKEYLEKLDRIRKGRFIRIKSLAQRYRS